MTKEQAIKDFEGTNENYRDQLSKYGYVMDKAEKDVVNQIIERNELAISALSENKGEWIDNGNGSYTCSKCKTEWTTSQIEKMRFCPTCGADMRELKINLCDTCSRTECITRSFGNMICTFCAMREPKGEKGET